MPPTSPASVAMVVDDCDADLELAVHVLERDVQVASVLRSLNGRDALESIRARLSAGDAIPCVIFLDLRMPIMSGLEFLSELAEMLPYRVEPPRIYVLTGNGSNPQRLVVLDHPLVADYIVKPLVKHDATRALRLS